MDALQSRVRWDRDQSRRVDNGSDSHFCRYQVFGVFSSVQGFEVEIHGECELDLRDGSPAARQMAPQELGKRRRLIVAHAASKARAFAVSGLRGSK